VKQPARRSALEAGAQPGGSRSLPAGERLFRWCAKRPQAAAPGTGSWSSSGSC